MTELVDRFDAAVADSTELAERPDTDTLLELYSLYKQSTVGDVQGDRPSSMDFAAAAKFDAWEERQGMSPEEAMQRYIDLVEKLKQS